MSMIVWLVLFLICLPLSAYSSVYWNRRNERSLANGYAVLAFAATYCIGDIASRLAGW